MATQKNHPSRITPRVGRRIHSNGFHHIYWQGTNIDTRSSAFVEVKCAERLDNPFSTVMNNVSKTREKTFHATVGDFL